MSNASEDSRGVGPIAVTWLGFSLVAMTLLGVVASRKIAVNTVAEAVLVIVITAGQTFALGSVAVALVALFRRFGSAKRRYQGLALVVPSGALGAFVLDTDVAGVADRLSGFLRFPYPLLLIVISILFAMVVPLAFFIGRALAKPFVRLGALLVGLVGAVVSVEVLAGLYEGLHLFSILSAGTFIAAALVGAKVPTWVQKVPRLVWIGLMGATTLWGLVSVTFVPSDLIRLALLGLPAAVLSPYSWSVADEGGEDWTPSPIQEPWFESRIDKPSIPATEPRILPPNSVVLFITIDSFRPELLKDEKRRRELPFLFQIRDESAYFTQARAAGAATSPSLSSLFAGAYYSQLYWTMRPQVRGTYFPYEDERPRFPALLSGGGVYTATVDSLGVLVNDFNIVRGFQEEKTVRGSGQYPNARTVLAPLAGFVRGHQGTPIFLYAHLLDAHSPYNSAKKDGPAYERYVAELGLIDLELRRLRSELVRLGVWDTLTLILAADHGEGFGEHGLTLHGNSLYDELLRVPLMIRVPGQTPRQIDEQVSLMDVGPTILDLFGQPTPSIYMGQSLVPLIAGKTAQLTRPIIAEGQLKRALVTPDGMKIIHDSRLRTVELYDLNADPGEKKNLYNKESKDAVAKLGMVKRFFEVHTYRRPGYKVPYRRW